MLKGWAYLILFSSQQHTEVLQNISKVVLIQKQKKVSTWLQKGKTEWRSVGGIIQFTINEQMMDYKLAAKQQIAQWADEQSYSTPWRQYT